MSKGGQSTPCDPSPVQIWALRIVLIRTEQQAHLAGGTHSSIDLLLDALRRGEVRARGPDMRWITPTEWNDLTIEMKPNAILGLHTPFVRRLDARRADPPAMTQVGLDAGQVRAWLARLRPTLSAPKPPPAVVRKKAKRKWQGDRFEPVLKKLYPPDGEVPEHIPTAIVHKQISDELKTESNIRLRTLPSIDTLARKLGRKE
jgi:hypothetical protein